jgi:hypothetical protein
MLQTWLSTEGQDRKQSAGSHLREGCLDKAWHKLQGRSPELTVLPDKPALKWSGNLGILKEDEVCMCIPFPRFWILRNAESGVGRSQSLPWNRSVWSQVQPS